MTFLTESIDDEDLEVIEQILNHPRFGSKLTKWERHFIEDIYDREQDLSERQRKVLNSICNSLGIPPTNAKGF